MRYHCCDRFRRNAAAAHPTLNGLDYLEVLDRDLPDGHEFRQRTLFVHFLKPFTGLSEDNVRLTGGDRIRNVQIEWAVAGEPTPGALTQEEQDLLTALTDEDRVLVIRTSERGDRSTYTLQLVRSSIDDRVPPGFDPQLAEIEFSFKVECPSDFDCRRDDTCPPPDSTGPEIDYLAKDYSSFRRLLLDRLRQLMPEWRGRSPADIGVTLAELLAYVGDQLSYQQDAIGAEAYLGTARRRVSVRRHVVLVDYAMHDGCNARVWIHLKVSGPVTLPQAGTQFLTRCADTAIALAPNSTALARALEGKPLVFEPLHDLAAHPDHNEMHFYTWGDERCCLPTGATTATLAGHLPNLEVGSYLLFEELVDPQTGTEGDADPTHRHVVRLTDVRHTDENNDPLVDPLNLEAITEIAWAEEDALPFALCLWVLEGGVQVSVARGNLVLADHGQTFPQEDLGTVPSATLFTSEPVGCDQCDAPSPVPIPPRFRPSLANGSLTHVSPLDAAAAASQAFHREMRQVRPAIELIGTLNNEVTGWVPRRTLLNSAADAPDFVVEIEDDGVASLRFGDDRLGRRPESGTIFRATYRTGNGTNGNVGAESIAHVVTTEEIDAVRNPLPASGGVDPESIAAVRRRAPEAFRTQERAVTTDDYAEMTERHATVQNAVATLRWTGSWHTVFVTVDREAGADLTPEFTTSVARLVDRYRMAGHDVTFREPVYVPLELALHVCVKPNWFRADVKRALLDRLSSRISRGGSRGLFHPDNITFGQPVYLSRIYAAAHAVPGVESVRITAFRRQYSDDQLALEEGRIALDRLEIARLDNDADYPERGVVTLEMHGGM